MNLPKLTDLDVTGKRVLVRLDLDTNPDPNDLRIKAAKETLDYLYTQKAKIIIIGHKGRPSVQDNQELSLKPFEPLFAYVQAEVKENLRFNPGRRLMKKLLLVRLLRGETFILTKHLLHLTGNMPQLLGFPNYYLTR